MSALWSVRAPAARRLVPLTMARLDAVLTIEKAAYAVPWTRGNFVDSIASGYLVQCLLGGRGVLLGYCVAMQGPGELHLLNLTVAPAEHGRGHARHMLEALVAGCRQAGVAQLWLEVRESNARARRLYRRFGLVEVGRRKAYYPALPDAAPCEREDALVMNLRLED